ncbi:MAG: 2-aminoethylphosphonate--pyruvate transaminase [Rhodospirillales bacterium]|nr:2-aminoethylphosphonate--pyruvate transaminase [Rhodospirillales bacterium]
MQEDQRDPWLLTPGPLTTSELTKQAMLRDWGSRDATFIETNRRIQRRLLDLADATDSHVCVPVQGSGTFAVEATLGTLIGKTDKALVLINGAYGQRIARILDILGRRFETLESAENIPNDTAALAARLHRQPDITHVIAVHCETTSGILNPIPEIAGIVADAGRKLIIDAMSAFGALPLSASTIAFEAVIASSNKCLEGVPGLGFALIETNALQASRGNSPSLCLDLFDQWQTMKTSGQWRFTPPTHVIAALDAALEQLHQEGGPPARLRRYRNNCRVLVAGMRRLGFETLLPDHLQAPIIVTFRMPRTPEFCFEAFYAGLKHRGFVIYPGKLTVAESFRMGCIGHLGEQQIDGALAAVAATLNKLKVADSDPLPAPST